MRMIVTLPKEATGYCVDRTVLRHHTSPPPVSKRRGPLDPPSDSRQCWHLEVEEQEVNQVIIPRVTRCNRNAERGFLCREHDHRVLGVASHPIRGNPESELLERMTREVLETSYFYEPVLNYRWYARWGWAKQPQEWTDHGDDF